MGMTLLTQEQIEAVRDKIPTHLLETFDADPQKFYTAMLTEKLARVEMFPSKSFVPNIAQERALLPYKQKHSTFNDYPATMIFTGSNAVGKTALLAIFVAGVTLGPDFIHPDFFGNHQYFKDCEETRKVRRFRVRLVCHSADMTDNGSAYQEISKWIPTAKFSGKQGAYFTRIEIPASKPGYHATVIDVKTHDMDLRAHAGPTLDLVLFNEPAPADIYGENEGRTRGGGRIAMFLTPLGFGAYLHKIINAPHPDGELVHVEGAIWDNCADIPGTRGHLTRQKIETMIRNWRAANALEVEARAYGKFMHLSGSVFTIFNPSVHVVPQMPIDPKWNIYQCIDPHPRKPAFSTWLALAPMNVWYVIGEYPTDPWDEISATPLTIQGMVQEMMMIEQGRHPQFMYGKPLNVMERIGDPNGMKAPLANNRTTMQDEFNEWLPTRLNLRVDNDIALRHNKIRELLSYDPERPVAAMNSPRLYVFSNCKNMIRAFREYRYKDTGGTGAGESDKLEQTWKDPIDTVGYPIMTVAGWQEPSAVSGHAHYDPEWAAICQGRGEFNPEEYSAGSCGEYGKRMF